MKDQMKPMLWMLLLGVIFFMWTKWNAANAPQPLPQSQQQTSQSLPNSNIPSANNSSANGTANTATNSNLPSATLLPKANFVTVKTDLLELKISLAGGEIIESKLLNFTESVTDKTPIKLLDAEQGHLFTIDTGLQAKNEAYGVSNQDIFTSDKTSYDLTGDTLTVVLHLQKKGLNIDKSYVFKKGKYDIVLTQKITNQTGAEWTGSQYRQIKREEYKPKKGLSSLNTFIGATYSYPGKLYERLNFSDLKSSNLREDAEGGWVAMIQHYFIVAVIPEQTEKNAFYTMPLNSDTYSIGLSSQQKTIAIGKTDSFVTTVYIGPKIKKDMLAIAPNLDKNLDYGKLFFISEFLFKVLSFIHNIVGNWGWAIVVTTMLIKCCFFPLAAKSFKSMAKMRKCQPEIERLKKNFEGDKQLLGKEMMSLYKKEGINPASGCLPVLLQIPVFIAFYYMLMESVELRQAPWILWITDLSVMDKFYVLPVINGALMFLQQKLNPPPADPMQAKVMALLPVIFGVMFLFFPSGLVLYWVVSNSFSIVQQYIINKKYAHLK